MNTPDSLQALSTDLDHWGIDYQLNRQRLVLQIPPLKAQLVASALKVPYSPQQAELEISLMSSPELFTTPLAHALNPDLICLDMDGVLINVQDSYDAAILATVKQLARLALTRNDIHALRQQGGFNNDWLLTQELLTQRGHHLSLSLIRQVFQGFYLGQTDADGKGQPGFVATEHSYLTDAMVNKLQSCSSAIVTGRPRSEAEAGAKLCQLTDSFIVSADDVSQPKPDPQGIALACQHFASQRPWMLGDTVDDMAAAQAAGALAIGVGAANREALYKAGALLVIDCINDLEVLLP
jgi:histidinol-phosphate aminotransferase